MNLHSRIKITEKRRRRLGLGHGSGRGKTAGRGTKGQKARGSIPLAFEGGAVPLIKRLPFLRGKGRNKVFRKKPIGINIEALSVFKKDSIVDLKALVEKKIIGADGEKYGVKIIGNGKLETAITVKLPVSKGARKQIEKAGGMVS